MCWAEDVNSTQDNGRKEKEIVRDVKRGSGCFFVLEYVEFILEAELVLDLFLSNG